MQWFRNLKIAHKLLGIFLIVGLTLGVVSLLSYYVNQRISQSIKEMYTDRLIPMSLLENIRSQNKEIEAITMEILLVHMDEARVSNRLGHRQERFERIDVLLADYEKGRLDDLERKWLAELKVEMTSYRYEQEQAIQLTLTQRQEVGYQYYSKKGIVHRDNMDALIGVMAEHSQELAAVQNWEASSLSLLSMFSIIFTSLLALLLVWLAFQFVNKLITRPLTHISLEVEAVAAGDLTGLEKQLPVESGDEIGILSRGLNKMSQTLSLSMQEMERKNQEIKFQAYHDWLTDLPNRRMFNEYLESLLVSMENEKVQRAIFFIDLDHFQDVNDMVDHNAGDSLLQFVADRLVKCLPQAELIARLGGDEFAAILPLEDGQTADRMTLAVLETIAQPYYIGNKEFNITTSLGISIWPHDGADVEALLSSADTAMKSAKHQGGNVCQYYTEAMRARIVKRLELANHLRQAIEKKSIQLYYQPKVNIKTWQITGMEALARWKDPELGWVSPAEFIPVADETGMIIPLGKLILELACRQNKSWQNAGLPALPVAVNISPREFQEPGFINSVMDILDKSRLESRWLELEITEEILMEKNQETIKTLGSLKQQGISISIDDFGTGYSSLNYLKRFSIDYLKIDKCFIDDIALNNRDAKLAESIIGLAKSLNLKVIAEGVETIEQLSCLKSYECDEIQGYFFSQPLPPSSFQELLASQEVVKHSSN
ncbi:MAG: EAL domain-containing protein [Syntrophomonas sp.]|nr:EAL domain-containing protein [Syntrophomonas sp.]